MPPDPCVCSPQLYGFFLSQHKGGSDHEDGFGLELPHVSSLPLTRAAHDAAGCPGNLLEGVGVVREFGHGHIVLLRMAIVFRRLLRYEALMSMKPLQGYAVTHCRSQSKIACASSPAALNDR